jgi:hypothetical protein
VREEGKVRSYLKEVSMGKKNSKEADEEKESKLYDRRKIYMDEFGNFVYGKNTAAILCSVISVVSCIRSQRRTI